MGGQTSAPCRVLVCALVALVLGGCAQVTQQAAPGRPFIIEQTSEPQSLDPLLTSGYTSEQIGSLVYSYLVRAGPAGELEPDLALRVPSVANGDISADGKVITYHLRPGVRWQDGVPFSAADIIATYRAIMNPDNPVPTRLGFDQAVRLRALDALTLRVWLRQRFAPFLSYFFETENYPVLPAHLLANIHRLSGSSFDAAPIGTGPFRVIAWHHADNLELAANRTYFGGAPNIARLRIEFVPSPQTIVLRLQTGEGDAYLAADPSVIAELRTNRKLRLRVVPIYGFLSLSMQTKDPALADPALRRSLAHAIDFSRAVVFASHGVLDTRDALRGLFTWAYVALPIPPSRARLPSSLTLSIDGTKQLGRTLAVIVQQELRQRGVALLIRTYSAQQFDATAPAGGPLAAGHYQLALHEVLTGVDPETSWFLACSQVPPAGYNITRFCEPQVDQALAEALSTNDRARRQRAYAVVQEAVARDVPFVAVAQLREIEALPTGLHGFQPSLETPYYHAERWSQRR